MKVFKTSRKISASPDKIFDAFKSPERMAKWWGPAGFTNTFNLFQFENGGKWSFVMHGPDGGNYPNESEFTEIISTKKIVIKHISEPHFILTVSIESSGADSIVYWEQDFENEDIAAKVASIVIPANEENLDRLTDEVIGSS